MKTLLVPTDFSSSAQHAADYAAALCSELQANLILFHAYLLPLALGEVPLVMITGDELRKSSEEGLKKEAERLSAGLQVKVECIARMGMAMDEIKDLVEERKVDVVIMSNKETDGLDKLFGSTTNSAINHLKTPLLVVPETARFTRFNKISYASDLHFQDSLECFELLFSLVRHFNAHLSVVHIIKEGKELSGDQQAGKSRLEAVLGNVDHEFHLIEYSGFEKGIIEYLNRERADLLVVVARDHNFFDRIFNHHTSKDLSTKTRLPLLILHEGAVGR